MKRIKCAICAAMMMFVFSACAGSPLNDSVVSTSGQEEIPKETEEMTLTASLNNDRDGTSEKEEGKIRSLGLSNWYVEELTEFLPLITITPALVQNEIHPYYQEQDVVPFIQDKGIVVQCWYPLGGRGHTSELLGDETIKSIAKAHEVSSAQVVLRWDLQRGIVVIPGSGNPDHIKENLNLFGFELTEDEMERISLLDRGEKHDWY